MYSAGDMNFLETIIRGMQTNLQLVILQEPREAGVRQVTCEDLLVRVAAVRTFLRAAGLVRGDRVVLLASNSVDWIACDLAILSEGLIQVPLYTRQNATELAQMIEDCGAVLILCDTVELREDLLSTGKTMPRMEVVAEVMENGNGASGNGRSGSTVVGTQEPPVVLTDADVVTIIYTSGTSGQSKGVVLTVANLDHMLFCTLDRLQELMEGFRQQERVFHYLPFCFAGSWVVLLSSLTRRSLLTLGTDLEKLGEHMKLARPHYFLNVPILLDRIRRGVEEKMAQRGGVIRKLFDAAVAAWARKQTGTSRALDALWLNLAAAILFAKVRSRISPNLRALICGSAPLSKETQLFFEMMGIPVLQVYGLTETTAICTMDKPGGPRKPGYVGLAIPGIEMKVGDRNEILVRGPHVFRGYWNRPADTAASMRDGWFCTGDQGEVDVDGNWRIIGRVKSVIVLSSGHNVEPDAIEAKLQNTIHGVEQVVLVGHEKPYLTVLLTGKVQTQEIERALAEINEALPHYKRVRGHHVRLEPFSIEDGFLTANGKLKRQRVLHEYREQIDAMYTAAATARN